MLDIKRMIMELADTPGVSGQEYAVSQLAATLLTPFVDHTEVDDYGNVTGFKSCGRPNAPTLLLDAHLDQIGFMVSEITPEGFLRFSVVGGLDQRVLLDCDVTVITKKHGAIPGVIASIPPHLLKVMDGSKATPIEEMVIDVGFGFQQASETICPGDYVTLAGKAFEMPGNTICGKAMDDRACFACILYALDLLRDKPIPCDLIITGTMKEEIGFHGAAVIGSRKPVDLAIAIDVCHAKTKDTTIMDNVYAYNGGPVVAMGSNNHPATARRLMDTAKRNNIPCQPSAMPAFTGTNAWKLQVMGNGIRTANIALPLKYMHTAVEMISLDDARYVAQLISAFVMEFDKGS